MQALQAQHECQEPIHQIAYCSLASTVAPSLAIVAQLQSTSAPITGLLMWEGRLLIHWLEGSAEQIAQLWDQVQGDTQQHCVVRLWHRISSKRVFADWEMRATNRQDMMAVVREAKAQANEDNEASMLQWQHAISTLSILLDPELTRFYANASAPAKPSMKAAA